MIGALSPNVPSGAKASRGRSDAINWKKPAKNSGFFLMWEGKSIARRGSSQ